MRAYLYSSVTNNNNISTITKTITQIRTIFILYMNKYILEVIKDTQYGLRHLVFK